MNKEQYKLLAKSIAPCWYDQYKDLPFQWWMQQQPEEFGDMLEIVSQCNPKIALEIGSAHGGCIPFYDHLVGTGGIVIGMEPQLDRGFSVVKAPYSTYQPKAELLLINGYSHKPEVYQQVLDKLNGKKLDFVFIDGDHNYLNVTDNGTSGAKLDFDMYAPLVRSGGYIGFHDIALEPGCTQIWKEACLLNKNIPIEIRYQGIGLIQVL